GRPPRGRRAAGPARRGHIGGPGRQSGARRRSRTADRPCRGIGGQVRVPWRVFSHDAARARRPGRRCNNDTGAIIDRTCICATTKQASAGICYATAGSLAPTWLLPAARPRPRTRARHPPATSTLGEVGVRMAEVNAVSAPSPSPSPTPAATEFSGAGLLCVVAMLNHVALTGGRITVSLTALQRSEERRVGKECRARRWREQENNRGRGAE